MNDEQIYKIETIFLRDDWSWNQLDEVFRTNTQILNAIDYFIRHLKLHHEVPGKVYHKLIGIGDNIREHNSFTQKQSRYVALALAGYWDQLDLFKGSL